MKMQDTPVDIAFVGRPADPISARRWVAEVELARDDGQRVLVAEDAAALPEDLSAGLILIADGALAARIRRVPFAAHLVLRRAGPDTGTLARALEDRLERRVAIAPLDPAERAALARSVPERWLTAVDWPPLIRAETLAAILHRPTEMPLRIALSTDGETGFTPEALGTALSAAGLGADAVEVVAGGSEAPAARGSHDRPADILLCGALPPPDILAEAMEAGTAVILPATIRETGDAPVLRLAWSALPERLAELLADPRAWRRQLLDLADQALDRMSDRPFLARLAAGVHGPALAPERPDPGFATEPAPGTVRADLALIGDFRRPDEVNAQALAQIRAHAVSGRKVLLVQTWNGKTTGQIHPAIDAAVRMGLARPLAPTERARVKCAQVLLPRLTIPALGVTRPALEAERWIVTETESAAPGWDAARLHLDLARLYGTSPDWAASLASARDAIGAQVPGAVRQWPVASPAADTSAPAKSLTPSANQASAVARILGIVAYAPDDAEAPLAALADVPGIEVHLLLAGYRRSLSGDVPDNCRLLQLEGTGIDGFVRLLDMLVIPPDAPGDRVPRLAAALALARRIPVLAAPGVAPILGGGPIYAAPDDWAPGLARWLAAAPPADRSPRRTEVDDAPFAAAMGLPRPGARRGPSRAAPCTPRVLFVTANGVGLGHVTRLSAIARRLPGEVEPVFATMSQAAGVLQDMGYATELLTSYTGKPAAAWRAALRERVGAIIDHHRPAAVVLDSSNPYPGVVEAAACRPDQRLIWVRRGMWRATQDNSEFLTRAPYFERVIEPKDIAESLASDRPVDLPPVVAGERILRVPPIGLLDEDELLDRAAARTALGLPPDPPSGGSVLVQLGSGTTRDLNILLGQVFEQLRQFDSLEIVLAQWLNAPSAYEARWPGVRLLSGYPIPRYYRAFDFTISAAGYNSFNDLLRFGVPTIFIANDAECMDDQGARARFAEQAEAAFDVQETDLAPLADCVAAIQQPQVRDFLAKRARSIALPNGAADAADAIAELL